MFFWPHLSLFRTFLTLFILQNRCLAFYYPTRPDFFRSFFRNPSLRFRSSIFMIIMIVHLYFPLNVKVEFAGGRSQTKSLTSFQFPREYENFACHIDSPIEPIIIIIIIIIITIIILEGVVKLMVGRA